MRYLIHVVLWLVPFSMIVILLWNKVHLPTTEKPQIKNVILICGGIVSCHFLAWYFWPELWWSLAKTFVFWLNHLVFFIVFLFFRKELRGGKKEITALGRTILTILFLGNISILWSIAVKEMAIQERVRQIEYDREEARRPKSFEVIAPAGEWSPRIPTLHGEIIRAHGPILLRTSNWEVVEREDYAKDQGVGPILKTNWVQVRSRTLEPVKVTVFR